MKKFIVLLFFTTCFSSCVMLIPAIAGGKNKTFEKNFDLQNKGTIEESISALKKVLYEDGWSNESDENQKIIFTKKPSSIKSMIAKKEFKLIVNYSNNKLNIQIIQHGNFKTGTEKKVDKTILKIKNKYENNN